MLPPVHVRLKGIKWNPKAEKREARVFLSLSEGGGLGCATVWRRLTAEGPPDHTLQNRHLRLTVEKQTQQEREEGGPVSVYTQESHSTGGEWTREVRGACSHGEGPAVKGDQAHKETPFGPGLPGHTG